MHPNLLSTLGRRFMSLAIFGGFIGLAAQWFVFHQGTTGGDTLAVPFLGNSGVHAPRTPALFWYAGVIALVIGMVGAGVCGLLMRRSR